MEQIINDNLLTIAPIGMISVWFILTCINGFCKKKWLYIAELIVLLLNIICDVCLTVVCGIRTETVGVCIQLITFAVVCAFLAIIVLKEFYKNCYMRSNRR